MELGQWIGTEKKAEVARKAKAAKLASYKRGRLPGTRFLTEAELSAWYATVSKHRNKRLGTITRLKGKK